MIPAPYTTIAAAIFLIGGLVTCFAGFRLFRVVLAIYGFYLGAMVASGMTDPSNTWSVAMYGLVGGIAGAVLMVVAYFVGVGLVGAGLAAIAVNSIWKLVGGDPPTLILIIACVIGAILALNVVRYVVIFGSAIGGSWTAIVGGLALMGNPSSLKAASAPGVWVVYPIDMLPRTGWVYALWIGGTLAGVIVQLATTKTTGAKRK
jgi:Domain of unknown function (DUF4203)